MEEDKSEEDLKKYRRMKRVVKRMLREARKRVNEKKIFSIAENFKENKTIFWKNEVRKAESLKLSSVRN